MKLLILVALFGLSLAQHNPQLKSGRTAIVHLFEWRWADIAAECERFLGPNGFGGVQISPPKEHIILNSPWRPWWQRYQPISYNLCSRSGSEGELRDMITRALDVTLNTGLSAGTYCDVIWGQKEGSRCTGKQIKVGSDGPANFYFSNTEEDPFVVIHANYKL